MAVKICAHVSRPTKMMKEPSRRRPHVSSAFCADSAPDIFCKNTDMTATSLIDSSTNLM